MKLTLVNFARLGSAASATSGAWAAALVLVWAPSAGLAREDSPPALSDAARQHVALAREYFAEARAVAAADGGALWGRSLAGPMLFADLDENLLYANEPDSKGALRGVGEGVWACAIPDDMAPANTATAWAGQTWTMILWPLPESMYPRRRLMAHELFHRIQGETGAAPGEVRAGIVCIPPAASPANAHLDGERGRTWLRLEMRALIEALVRDGAERRGAIEDALVFREVRRATSEVAREEERSLEMNEGLAEYTGHRLCGLPADALRDRAAVRLESDERNDSFARSFAYATGPAYGLLLDGLAPGWQKKLTPTDDLGALLAKAAGVSASAGDEAGAAKRAEKYGGARVFQSETEREKQRVERVVQYRKRFESGPTLVLPATSETNYSFNPYGTETVPGLGQVFKTMKVTDAWGSLEVSGGALLVRNENGRVEKYVVTAPPAAAKSLESTATDSAPSAAANRTITGDGWTLRLNEGWRLEPGGRSGDKALKGPQAR